jgi:hypothetical protein
MTREFGAMLYEQIGIIRLFRDGTLDREWDLTELLKGIFHDDPIDVKRPVRGFNKLRREVWETQKKFGLSLSQRRSRWIACEGYA